MEQKYFNEYRQLALNIFYYRKARGLSQMQLAEQVDISRTHMSRIENCDCALSLDVVFAIARALDVPASKLFEHR